MGRTSRNTKFWNSRRATQEDTFRFDLKDYRYRICQLLSCTPDWPRNLLPAGIYQLRDRRFVPWDIRWAVFGSEGRWPTRWYSLGTVRTCWCLSCRTEWNLGICSRRDRWCSRREWREDTGSMFRNLGFIPKEWSQDWFYLDSPLVWLCPG